MKKIYLTALLFTLLSYNNLAVAVVCYNSKGIGYSDNINYDLSSSFNSSNNQVGSIVDVKRTFYYSVNAVCPPHSAVEPQTKRSYVTTLPVLEIINKFKYIQINEYLSGAMQITDSAIGYFYPPVSYVQMGSYPTVSQGKPFPVEDKNFLFRLKVLRPFIDHVVIPKQTLFTVYVTTLATDPLIYPVYTISYSGSINVPQSCEVNAGQIINIPFGKIAAHQFNQAGNKPEMFNPVERQIEVQCKNIKTQALVTLRLESENSVNDMMVSNNPNIGFKVSSGDGHILRPNDVNSRIKFNLDATYRAKIPLKFWPVSVTGVKPAVGIYTGRGYLRVDYD